MSDPTSSRLLLTELRDGVIPLSERSVERARECLAQARFAEALLTSDEVLITINGPNLEFAAIVRWLGPHSAAELIAEGVLRFVFLGGSTTYLTQDNIRAVFNGANPGLTTLRGVASRHSRQIAGPWRDPFHSATYALARQTDLGGVQRSHLARQVAGATHVLDDAVFAGAYAAARKLLDSDLGREMGIVPELADAGLLTEPELRSYLRLAQHELEISIAAGGGATDFYVEPQAAQLLAKRLHGLIVNAKPEVDGLREIMRAEGVPDFASAFSAGAMTLPEMVGLRRTENARRFRQWLRTSTEEKPAITAYNEALQSVGPLDRLGLKVLRFSAMTLAGSLLNPVPALALSVGDTFLLDRLVKGWSPRSFIDDLRSQLPKAP